MWWKEIRAREIRNAVQQECFFGRKRPRNVTCDAMRDSSQGQGWDILIGILSRGVPCSDGNCFIWARPRSCGGLRKKERGEGVTKDQMLGKLLSTDFQAFFFFKIAHRWPTQNTKNLIYDSSDGLSWRWPLWQIYIYRKFTDCDQAENPGAILAFHHYKARMFD